MKINEFITEYTETNPDTVLLADHVLKRYVPLEEKQAMSQNIVNSALYRSNGEFAPNHVALYMLRRMALVDMYTDLEREDENVLAGYNALNEAGVFRELESVLDAEELAEFDAVLEMTERDVYDKEQNPARFVHEQIERFGRLVGESLGPVLENMDWSVLAEKIKELK